MQLKGLIILLFIWNVSSAIYYWESGGTCATDIFTYKLPNKYRTSTGQVENTFHTDNVNIKNLIKIIGDKEMSVKAMMESIGLKGRDNFLNQYLTPALSQGYVRMLYPESPRHPRQKYLLTPKGIDMLDYLISICKE